MRQLSILILAAAIFTPFYAITQNAPAPKSISGNGFSAQQAGNSNVVSPAANSAVSPFSQIDFNWAYTPNAPVCGRTTRDCLSGFTLTNTTTGVIVATPSSIRPTVLSYVYLWPGGVPYGNYTFSLVANGYDENGDPAVSTPATVTVSVPHISLSAPISLAGRAAR